MSLDASSECFVLFSSSVILLFFIQEALPDHETPQKKKPNELNANLKTSELDDTHANRLSFFVFTKRKYKEKNTNTSLRDGAGLNSIMRKGLSFSFHRRRHTVFPLASLFEIKRRLQLKKKKVHAHQDSTTDINATFLVASTSAICVLHFVSVNSRFPLIILIW